MVGLRLLDGFQRGLQVGPRAQRDLAKVVERLKGVGKIEGSGHVELLHRGAVVEQLQQLNFCRAQVDDRRLQLGLVLHALELDAVEIDLGNVAGIQTVAADGDDFVVVIEVGFGQIEQRLGLERLHKRRAQGELQVALQILMLRFGDLRTLLRTLQAQFALVVALVQVAHAGHDKRACKRLPNAVVRSDLGSVRSHP